MKRLTKTDKIKIEKAAKERRGLHPLVALMAKFPIINRYNIKDVKLSKLSQLLKYSLRAHKPWVNISRNYISINIEIIIRSDALIHTDFLQLFNHLFDVPTYAVYLDVLDFFNDDNKHFTKFIYRIVFNEIN